MNRQERLLGVVRRASESIANNGRLRTVLRRASSSLEVVGFEATDALVDGLQRIPGLSRFEGSIADGGMVLMAQRNVLPWSKIENADAPPSGLLARRLGEKAGERRRLSELRFQRLLRAADGDDRLQQMRRAIALLDTRIHPLAVLEAWLDLHNEQGRRNFARAYFTGLSIPDPATKPNPTVAADAA